MDERLKERLVGAAVLVSLAVIFVPMLLGGPDPEMGGAPMGDIPPAPLGEFNSAIVPLGEPATPLLDREDKRRAARAAEVAESKGAPPATQTPTHEASAAPPKAKARKPRSRAPAELVGWAVQLGSFSNDRNAKALRDRLRKQGYRAFVESARGAKGVVTRVYVGPELVRKRALAAAKKLQASTRLKGMVVRYPRD